jgi:putative ABC transport system substrate-binding protein
MIKKQKTGTVWDFESGLFRISIFGFRILLALTVTAFVLVVLGQVVQAQQSKKVARLGYLASGSPTSESARSGGLLLALRELGYIEGQNIATEYRYAEGKNDRAPQLAAELVRLKIDIIV